MVRILRCRTCLRRFRCMSGTMGGAWRVVAEEGEAVRDEMNKF